MAMNDPKMTGKQEVTGTFNLDAFVGEAEGDTPIETAAPAETARKKMPAKKVPKKKPAEEPVSERIQLLITKSEAAKLKKEAGLVPTSKFLRKYLQDSGLI